MRLWADIKLLIKDVRGNFATERFRVDSGAEITTFPAYHAERLGLPMPQQPVRGAKHVQTGLEMRSGTLRFRIDGMDQTEYAVPSLFLGDPAIPPTGPLATLPRKLLQPLALVDYLRFSADKDPTSAAIYGHVLIEKK